jgi:DNA-directed RNA polymerase subunit H (RpoH/RPB5)
LLETHEEAALLQKFRVSKDNLPSFRPTDAVVRYFGWGLEQTIEIKSTMGGSIEPYYYYRVIRTDNS